ncbi:adt-1 [Pristionchus pacificus]|uniref:Adt-1 n=1 Tax=Pristionchus pacificus TaxID=54126 RepID=A0A2A6CF94_PRIPA|nr:adt-1 [Pristionchus pacificus]|eukprot:PDM76770.1 adt-1 [Pristionchus pacificus]
MRSIALLLPILWGLQIESLHHRLTKWELHQTFGVNHVDSVPEYSLARIEKTPLDGGRKGLMEVRLHAFNETYVMRVKPNHRLVSEHAVAVIRDGNSTEERRDLISNCHYYGQLVSHSKRKASRLTRESGKIRDQRSSLQVAISDCLTTMGTLDMHDHFLVLHPLPSRSHEWQEEKHIVYKRSSGLLADLEDGLEEELIKLNAVDSAGFCDSSASVDSPLTADLFSLNYTVPSIGTLESSFIFPQMDPITLEIGLFLDSKLYEHFQREFSRDPEQHLIEFSLALINNVHVLYQQPTLNPNLDIVIVRFEMWKTQPAGLETSVHKNGQAQSLLDGFCRHQSRINPGTDLTHPEHWDHGVLLTGYDIYHTTASVAGVAPVARMCDPLFACSLVEGMHLGRSFVLAHEMGHNMGMVHDGVQNSCSRSCCLMSAVNGAGKTTWSECSVREFNAFLLQLDESGRGNCLRDSSIGISERSHTADSRLPGQRFTADQQCSYFWGRDYVVEIPNGRQMDDICRILWCGNGGSTISTAHPALEGSWCGGEKFCIEGRCQYWKGSSPAPRQIDGNWSPWAGEAQCPVRQCHVSNSIHVKPQHRECINPAPNNGGQTCKGSALRGLLCGAPSSSCLGLSRQEYGDRVCTALQNDPARPDRQLTGKSFNHGTQPCRVWCHLENSELIRNKGQFPDGAPCGHNSYCVGGTCLQMACEEKALIAEIGDCPSEDFKDGKGTWSKWSPWSECSASCGEGKQIRKRECVSIEDCIGKRRERRACGSSSCESVGEWGSWSECSSPCGEGVEKRTRPCNSDSCSSTLEESRSCNRGSCFSDWTEWGACSVSCGGGTRLRRRDCPPGQQCDGSTMETRTCAGEPCPVVEVWGDWLPCSVSCGIGFQLRERLCNGVLCATNNKQARTCNEQTCPAKDTSYAWDGWSEWTQCSSSCGEGFRRRSRRCIRGDCPPWESSIERRRCVLGPCPEWGSWGSWTECADCSPFATRSRSRTCSAIFPVFDSTSIVCPGPSAEVESCSDTCLSDGSGGSRNADVVQNRIHGLTTAVEYKWAAWTEWTPCSVSCAEGRRSRSRKCAKGDCPSEGSSSIEQCSQPACPKILNGWLEWSEWSGCSTNRCVPGQEEIRRRMCSFPFACPTMDESEKRPCQCTKKDESSPLLFASLLHSLLNNEDEAHLLPVWSEWSDWATCSCFSLTSTRRRYCRVRSPSLQGFCAGPLVEQRSCEPSSCSAVHGNWGGWGEWSDCSRDCEGTGHQIRNRMCANPIPSNRGSFCTGLSFDQRACSSSTPCEKRVDGNWAEWTGWSPCSDACGGHSSRTRYCTNPRPTNGGNQCFGPDFELQPCADLPNCKHSLSHGGWSSWSTWSPCPSTCDFSLQHRERQCSSPPPRAGGRICEGLAHMTAVCTPVRDDCPQWQESQWEQWSEWSPCLSNCGQGRRFRSRLCSSSSTPCFGRSSQSQKCSEDLSLCLSFLNATLAVDSQLATLDD